MNRASVILVVVAIALIAFIVFHRRSLRTPQASVGEASSDIKGQMARDFALQALDGRTVHLSDFHGKAVLLHFWATSWLPCRVEMQWFEQMHKQYGPQGLQVLGVVMDSTDEKNIAEYASNLGVDYPILMGTEEVAGSYGGIKILPVTIYVGRDGKIVEKVLGVKEHDEIEAEVTKALSRRR